jgi:DNA-binding CsgD family transcriptional regulator
MANISRYFSIDPHLSRRAQEGLERLTVTELQHLDLIMEGHSAKEAARITKNSPRTVELHRQNIREKLGARDILHLALILFSLAFDEARLEKRSAGAFKENGMDEQETPKYRAVLH